MRLIAASRVARGAGAPRAVEVRVGPLEQPVSAEGDWLCSVAASVGACKRLGVLSGGWVTAQGGRTALVQVWADQSLPDGSDTLLLNPLLAFNLQVRLGDTILVTPRFFEEGKPPVAARVTIARVRSPESSGHAEYGPALREFFAQPRLLQQGDVIAVPLAVDMALDSLEDAESEVDEEERELLSFEDASEPAADENGQEQPAVEPAFFDKLDIEEVVDDVSVDREGRGLPLPQQVVFFQVTELSATREGAGDAAPARGPGMIVDGVGGETMLAQAGAVNNRVPDRERVLDFYTAAAAQKTLSEKGAAAAAATAAATEPQATEQRGRSRRSEPERELARVLRVGARPRGMLRRFAVLLHGGKGTGKRSMVRSAARRLGYHAFEASLTPLRGLREERAAKKLRGILQEAAAVAPCVCHLRHIQALAPLSAGAEKPDEPEQVVATLRAFSHAGVLLVASTTAADDVPAVLRGCFTHEVPIPAPDKSARLELLRRMASGRLCLSKDVDLEALAVRSAGRTAAELRAVFANAACLHIKETEQQQQQHGGEGGEGGDGGDGSGATTGAMEAVWAEIGNRGPALPADAVDRALEALPSSAALDIGAPKIPQVYWKDVGGLGHAKDEILDMVQLPLRHPELFANGVKQRSGILLYGPPGTGKTLLAKAVATECNLNFISVKGPELLDMYIGESERKVRQVFETARSAKPCVLFFDELDSLAPQRGRGADSGGVMDRVVSQLLTEIDGMQGNSDVFVIGATNRPDLLDQSLLRPGRFDRLIYLGICRDREAQLKVLRALSRKFRHGPDVDLEQLVSQCPFNFTGADFYALSSGAMANALQRRVREIQALVQQRQQEDPTLTARRYLTTLSEDELEVSVQMEDYVKSLRGTIPSVSEDEIRHYEALRDKFSSAKAAPAPTPRLCPSCAAPTLKEGGCDDMVCPRCETEYSWEAAQPAEAT